MTLESPIPFATVYGRTRAGVCITDFRLIELDQMIQRRKLRNNETRTPVETLAPTWPERRARYLAETGRTEELQAEAPDLARHRVEDARVRNRRARVYSRGRA